MRRERNVWVVVGVCAALGVGGVVVTRGGDVNPPIGAVAPTMHSLDEIFAMSGQSAGGVTTTVLGDPRSVAAMTVVGGVQGPILGEDIIEGVPDVIKVFGFSHDLIVPFDPITGLLTGPRQHSPFVVVKQLDKASPKLYQALTSGEFLTDVTLRSYRLDPAGVPEQYFTYTLTNVRIVGIRPFTQAVSNTSYRQMEEVTFLYQQIQWTWESGPIISADTW
jgi:type VI secretion system secreted protein Hcp